MEKYKNTGPVIEARVVVYPRSKHFGRWTPEELTAIADEIKRAIQRMDIPDKGVVAVEYEYGEHEE